MPLQLTQKVPEEFREAKVLNAGGEEIRMAGFWAERPALLIFVRHFGCIGCTAQMNAIAPRLEEIDSLGIRTVVIGNGKLEYLDGFLDKFMLRDRPVEVYTDPSLNVYKQANLVRNALYSFGPGTWWDYLKAFSKGIGQSSIQGDNLQLGGTLFIDEEGVLEFYFRNKSVANHSDPNEIINSIYKYIGRKHPELM